MGDKIHRPLGTGKSRPRKRQAFAWRFVGGVALILLIAGAGLYVALAPSSLGTGDEIAASSGEPAETAQDDDASARREQASAADEAAASSAGPSVTTRPGETADRAAIAESAGGQDLHVAHLPEPGLIEETDFGPLPVRGADGKRAMDAYAANDGRGRGARIAVVVGGLGLSQTGSQYAIETLPQEVTLAFAASGNSLSRWMQAARRDGHEILLQVPFEPYGYPQVDPGRFTLTVEASEGETLDMLHEAMGRITNYTGIMSYMGTRFLADRDALRPVLEDLARRGLFFFDDGTAPGSIAKSVAASAGLPFAEADAVIDRTKTREAIFAELDALEAMAVRNGSAIGTASAFEGSVDAIAAWIKEAASRNVQIVGLSSLADDPEGF